MLKALEEAFRQARELPEDRQELVAKAIDLVLRDEIWIEEI